MTVVDDYRALLSDLSWTNATGQGTILTYSFSTAPDPSIAAAGSAAAASFQAFSADEENVVRACLAQWSAVSGITFYETTAHVGDLTFGYYNLSTLGADTDVVGQGYLPSPGTYIGTDGMPQIYSNFLPEGGDVILDTSYHDNSLTFSDLKHVLLHEIGHAIGLKHPFDTTLGSYTLDSALDNGSETVMSYNGLRSSVLEPLDIAAIQHIYGAKVSPTFSYKGWDAATESVNVTGSPGPDDMFGSGGDDVFYAEGGADAVSGAEGDDTLFADGGAVQFNGGPGFDTAYTGLAYDPLIGVGTGASGTDSFLFYDIAGTNSYQSYSDVERLVFTNGVYQNGAFAPTVPVAVTAITLAGSSIDFSGTAIANETVSASGGSVGASTMALANGQWSAGFDVGVGSYPITFLGSASGNAPATGAITLARSGHGDTISADFGSFKITDPTTAALAFIGGGGTGPVLGGSVTLSNAPGGVSALLANGNWTLTTGTSGSAVMLGTGVNTVVSKGPDNVTGGAGAATIISTSAAGEHINAGAGAETVFAQAGKVDATGGTGALTFIDQSGGNSVTGGMGGLVAFGDAIGSTFAAPENYFVFVSGGGNDSITAAAGAQAPLVFGAQGADVHIAAIASGSFVVAGLGNETIDASQSSGSATFFANSGSADLIGSKGSNFFGVSNGDCTLTGGSANTYQFIDGHAGGASVITDFTAQDGLYLEGYGTGAADGIASQTIAADGVHMTLTDGTTILFSNLTSTAQLDGKIHHN